MVMHTTHLSVFFLVVYYTFQFHIDMYAYKYI